MAAEERWHSRKGLATLLDAFIWLSPAVVASATVWLVAPTLTGYPRLWRFAGLIALATVAASATGKVVRRLLPLASLLRLTMVFPDRAPSRFRLARSAGNTQQLLTRLASDDVSESTAAEHILGLVAAMSAHDRKTRGHAERVRAYTDLLSEELGLDQDARDRLRWAALLHDIGKLQVPAAILNKAGKLDNNEWSRLYAHPDAGARLAAPLMSWLGDWGQAIPEHHERFDGTGYPRGIRGLNISRAGRMVAVVDSFETMTAARSYKKPMSRRDARAELTKCAGTQFDPAIVRAFLRVSLARHAWAMGPFTFLAELPFLRLWQAGGQAVVQAAPAVAGTAAVVALAPAAPFTSPTPSPDAASARIGDSQGARGPDGSPATSSVGGATGGHAAGPTGNTNSATGEAPSATDAGAPASPTGTDGASTGELPSTQDGGTNTAGEPGSDELPGDSEPGPGAGGGGPTTDPGDPGPSDPGDPGPGDPGDPGPGDPGPSVQADDFVAYAAKNRTGAVPVGPHVSNNADPSTLSVTRQPGGANVSVSGGKFNIAPKKDFVGSASFDYRICGSGGGCDEGTVTLRVLDKDQRGADFSGADLSGLDLHDFDFDDADLSGADLSNANVNHADFRDGNLRNADFSGANAHDANFERADVHGADFSGADMSGANTGSAPNAKDDPVSVPSGGTVRVDVLDNDAAPYCPLDPSSITIKSQPKHGTVTVNGDGSITYRADAGKATSDDFEYRVANEFGKTDSAKVKVTIN